MGKILIKYSKSDRMKFISHLELIRVIERALRRANIPLKFSQGYNPHPKIAFAAPLSVGVSSEGEYLNIELEKKIDIEEFKDTVNKSLPKGIKFISCKYIEEKSNSLMSEVNYAAYIVKCIMNRNYEQEDIEKIINNFLNKEEISYEKVSNKKKKVKIINIRDLISEISILSCNESDIILKMILSTGSRGNLKPEVVVEKLIELEGLDINKDKVRFHRLQLFAMDSNNKLTPIDKVY